MTGRYEEHVPEMTRSPCSSKAVTIMNMVCIILVCLEQLSYRIAKVKVLHAHPTLRYLKYLKVP